MSITAVCLRLGMGLVLFGGAQTLGAQAVQPANPPAPPPPLPSTPAGNAPSAPVLTDTPGAIYKQAMHPLDVVRSSMENWSDAEMAALAVGMRKAAEACTKAQPEDYEGDDLYDLARLCSLGQNWVAANNAASRYVDSRAEAHRAQAMALSMNALVHMKAMPLAIQTARIMLSSLPYDAEVAYAIRFLKDTLEKDGDPEALALAENEHDAIIAALKQGAPLKAVHGEAVMSVGGLYDSAMEKAFWERFSGNDTAAMKTAAEYDAALANATALPGEDQQRIQAIQTQFRLLGQRLPEIKVLRSLQNDKAKPRIEPDYGTATVLVLFPDWCAQCRRMMKTLTAFAVTNGQEQIHAYGLMFAEDNPLTGQASNPDAGKEVQGTATLLVAPETAKTLGAIDYPFGVIVDHAGKVQYVGALATDAFTQSGNIDRLIKRMVAVEAHRRMSAAPSQGAKLAHAVQ